MNILLIDIFKSLLDQRAVVDNSWYAIAIVPFYASFYICFNLKTSNSKKIAMLIVSEVSITVAETLFIGMEHDWWIMDIYV